MTYLIPAVLVLLLPFVLGFSALALVRKLRKKPMKRHTCILLSLALSLLLSGGAALIYLNIHYSAGETAVQAMASSGSITVTETDSAVFFDGAGEDTALVFYPGAKVDAEAYAPLLRKIAEGGVDCFALKVPFRMAFFNLNAADSVINQYSYQHYLLSGHSLGGVAASGYAANHADKADGLVLLASYPTQPIGDSVSLLTVYGSNDGVLNKSAYEDAKKNFPKDSVELVIEGGNHANFADYGAQDGDKKADISAEQQQEQTAEAILSLSGKL